MLLDLNLEPARGTCPLKYDEQDRGRLGLISYLCERNPRLGRGVKRKT